jgi:Uma2 family endonuclease
MGPVSVAQQMTAEEFIAAPEPQRGRPWNLIDGEVVVNLPTLAHRQAQDSVLFALQVWVRAAQGRGAAGSPADIGLDERNVFAPDVMWHAADRMPALDSRPPYPMPDLAVEVRSPATWRFDLGAKKAEYERRGLRELWLVDTDARTVLVYRRSRPDTTRFDVALELSEGEHLSSPLLPGFDLAVEQVFRQP